MQIIASILLSIAGAFATKMALALGIGYLTFTGFDIIQQKILNAVTTSWGQVDGSAYQLLSLAGIPDAMGIVFGALAVKLTMLAFGGSFGKLIGAS